MKRWLPYLVAAAGACIVMWSAQRLVGGKPHWSSLAAIRFGDADAGPGHGHPGGPATPWSQSPHPPRVGMRGGPRQEGTHGWQRAMGSLPRQTVSGSAAPHGMPVPPGPPEVRTPGTPAPAAGPPTALPKAASEERDPVCGTRLGSRPSRVMATYHGKPYYFCSSDCLTAFLKDPGRYR